MDIVIFLLLLPDLVCSGSAGGNSNNENNVYRSFKGSIRTPMLRNPRSIYDTYGGEKEQNPDDPKYKEIIEDVVYRHVGLKKENTKKITVTKITTQVAGVKIKNEFQVKLKNGNPPLRCRSEIWKKLELRAKRVTYQCITKDTPYNEECDVYSKDYVSKISLTGSCYRIASIKANWNQAYANCEAEGAHLAVLNNEEEFAVVKQMIHDTPKSVEAMQFFVGIRAKKTEPVVFRTVFNQTLDQLGYQPWEEEEPNNKLGVEYCVAMRKRNGEYNDTVCRNRYSYICEKERRTST